MSAATPPLAEMQRATASSAPPALPWFTLGVGAAAALMLFTAPALPDNRSATGVLRTFAFFEGIARTNPIAPGDGPLAFLRSPAFAQVNALDLIIWQLSASIALALGMVASLLTASRGRLLAAATVLGLLGCWSRDAAFWCVAGLLTARLWDEEDNTMRFLCGAALALVGLLSAPLAWAGILAIAFAPGRRPAATAAGWLFFTLAGWAGTSPVLVARFFAEIISVVADTSPWRLVAGAVLLGVALWSLRVARGRAALLAAAAGLVAWAEFPHSAPPLTWDRAWSVIAHPQRFERRVLLPRWREIADAHPLPDITEELGARALGQIDASALAAPANGLRVRSNTRAHEPAPMIAATADLDRWIAKGYRPLFSENGLTLLTPTSEDPTFNPWTWAGRQGDDPLPLRIEAGRRPVWREDHGTTIAVLPTPARVTFGPTGRYNPILTGSVEWIGSAGAMRVWQVPDGGASTLLSERGFNPQEHAPDTGAHQFRYPLKGRGHDSVMFAAESPEGAELHLRPFRFEREFNRMLPWTLTPRDLFINARFNMHPLAIFSPSDAVTSRGEGGDLRLLLHLPANLKFAKPAGTTRLRATYGFVTGAYSEAAAGTNGAIFSIILHSGKGYSRELFRRELRPRSAVEDQGVQQLDLDLTGLPDGIVDLNIEPYVPGDSSFGWTYWGNVNFVQDDVSAHPGDWHHIVELANRHGIWPLPAGITRGPQNVTAITSGGREMVGVHAPAEILIGAQAGVSRVVGTFGMSDASWAAPERTDGAEFIVLWRDHHGETELFRRVLRPQAVPADRGPQKFSVSVAGRGSGIIVLRTTHGPDGGTYWDWTGWTEVSVR